MMQQPILCEGLFALTVVLALINSLVSKRFELNFMEVIFNLNFVIDGWGVSYDIALRLCFW